MALALALIPLAVYADEKLPVLQAGNVTYSNITVTTVSATDVYFTFAGGMGNVKLKDLSPDVQKRFNFDPKKAKAVEQKQAENKLQYHDQLLHQPPPPDMTREPAAPAAVQEPVWQRNLSLLLKKAGDENKLVLFYFTGSDWSPWCVKFEQEVLGSAKFAAYSGQRLEFVKVDFSLHTPQPDDLKLANAGLVDHFKIKDYPTCVLLDPSGKELGRQVGYLPGGPDAFIGELEGFSPK